jgi:hypothetical protein
VDGYLATLGRHQDAAHQYDPWVHYREEIAALLLLPPERFVLGSDAPAGKMLEKLAGDHPRVRGGTLVVNLHEFQSRLGRYRHEVLPRFKALRQSKHRLLEQAERRLRTHEFKARVLTSFVRNRLIDEVYLPLIGDNLAKQMGAAGDSKRSDRMGMLLLISPPGYGKTTLMEYIANRLGLVFVKVNGPALGHGITSLDPAEASNASAREEVQRINPYTESGDRFQIPDMLANRADVYNLGEIIGDSREAFELSYIENCLTSNAVLQPLSRMSSRDQRAVIRAAERGTVEGLELEGNLGSDQVGEMISVLEKLLRARDIVLKINREYIRSAAQADAYRTEPPFKLQGSYRNMNRLAERVVAVMNDAELQSLISSNYEQDAQTLTRDSESNLLKFKELIGILTPAEAERWEQIQYAYVESVRMQGVDGEDRAAQVLRSLTGLRDGLEAIRRVIAQAISADQESDRQAALRDGLASVTSGMTALGLQVSGAIEDGLEGMRQAAAQPPEQKVLVQHSVPRVMTDLVRSQFQLLYDGLRPVLEAAALNNTQLERLRSSIDDCLTQYKAVQAEIDRAAQE